MTINLPELKRRRGPTCELFTSPTEGRNQSFITAETSLDAGREEDRKLIRSPCSLLAATDPFTTRCWSGGFVLSIFFLPQPSLLLGARGGGKKSAKHQAPGGSQELRCQKGGKKKS